MASFGDSRKRGLGDSKSEGPPNSRLFIICSKDLTEDNFREAFSEFGEIEDVWVVKDRATGERKGIAYVKYAKTSEAAAALEALNGKSIGNASRRITVKIASNRDQGSRRDVNEEEKMLRLFVVVPKTLTNEELHDEFKVYGEIDYAAVIKEKGKQESKGFAYVKYHKFSHAAAAYEQCDRKYRAVFAEPKPSRQTEVQFNSNFTNYRPEPARGVSVPDVDDGFTSLQVISSHTLDQDHIWKLFDIVPGMDYCRSRQEGSGARPDRLVSIVVYNSPQSASYALDKLHGFEYPVGSRLIVKPDYSSRTFGEPRGGDQYAERGPKHDLPNRLTSRNPDLVHLAETIAQATSIIKAAGFSTSEFLPSNDFGYKELQCSVKLPDPKPVLDKETRMEARCFIVCFQHALPIPVLRDAFCRFGSLIDVYLLPNRNCGYVKYATRESAENAIKTLHGAEVCGVRLKVVEAEDPESNKRMRIDDDDSMT